jgi:hypothetical protein
MNENIRVNELTVFNPQTGEFAALPEILQFSVDKPFFVDETPVTASWSVINATSVKLNDEPVALTGSKVFYSNDLLALSLTASNEAGELEPEIIIVDIDRRSPIIHSFRIDTSFAIKGSPIQLSWQVEGARKIEIDNGIGEVTNTDHKIVTLDSNGIFTLAAWNYFGIKSEAKAIVPIFPTPIIEGIFIPKPHLNINTVAMDQPTFNLQVDYHNSCDINFNNLELGFHDIVLNTPEFDRLDDLGNKYFFKKENINTVMFPHNIFRILAKKQKEITQIVKSIWRREIKKELNKR